MDRQLLTDMARHQAWADREHWKVFRANPKLLEDAQIRTRLEHMAGAASMLTGGAMGKPLNFPTSKSSDAQADLESVINKTNEEMMAAVQSVDLDQPIQLPRGPSGPFAAPAGVLLLQAITHSQAHRAQNAARMRDLGVTPPMTDFILWYAVGRP